MSPLTQNRFSLWGSPLTEGILFAFRTSHCIFLTVILSIVDVINSLYLQIVVLDFCFSAIDNMGVHCKKFPDNNKPHEKGFSQSKTLHIIFKYGKRVFSLLLKTLLGFISLLNPQKGFVIGCKLLNP